jgi:hypothetical protein
MALLWLFFSSFRTSAASKAASKKTLEAKNNKKHLSVRAASKAASKKRKTLDSNK